MAEEADQTLGDDTNTETTETKQTVTAEQFAELQEQLKAVQAAQSGSDKKVQELTKALTEANEAKETTKKTADDRIAELEKKALSAEKAAERERLRSVGRALLDEANMKPPAYFDRLIGESEDETRELMKAYIEDEQAKTAERNKEFDRKNGRKLSGPEKNEPTAYESLLEMSDEELQRLGPQAIASVINKAGKT